MVYDWIFSLYGNDFPVSFFQMLTEDTARSIGMSAYYAHMRKVLNGILRALDVQFGRPLIMTNVQNNNKVKRMAQVWKLQRGGRWRELKLDPIQCSSGPSGQRHGRFYHPIDEALTKYSSTQ